MNLIPIDLEPEEILIRADRRLSFEVVSAFRSPGTTPIPSIHVIKRWDEQNRLLAEFSTPTPLPFGISSTLKTVEYVTFYEPERIEFELAEHSGILHFLEDRFLLENENGWTRFRYESRFGIGGWVFGWVLGKLVFEAMFKQHMRRHLAELKETIEARARRSRQYPLPEDEQPETPVKR
jgi:hypothetical protein